MAVKAVQVPVPADGTEVAVVDSDGDTILGNEMSFRNTGRVNLLVGGKGTCVFPLARDPDAGGFGEALGISMGPGDVLYARLVQAGELAGEITALKAR